MYETDRSLHSLAKAKTLDEGVKADFVLTSVSMIAKDGSLS